MMGFGGFTKVIAYGFKRDAGDGIGVCVVHFTEDAAGALVGHCSVSGDLDGEIRRGNTRVRREGIGGLELVWSKCGKFWMQYKIE